MAMDAGVDRGFMRTDTLVVLRVSGRPSMDLRRPLDGLRRL